MFRASRSFVRSFSSIQTDLRLAIIGAPGSGKGTVCSLMVKEYNLDHISTGDLLREEARKESGQAIRQLIESGQLVPTSVVQQLLAQRLGRAPGGWLLDGFPRDTGQATLLTQMLKDLNKPLNLVFYLDIPEDIILARLGGRMIHASSGRTYNETFNPPKKPWTDDVTGEPLIRRPDDEPAFVKRRFDDFKTKTKPTLDYYQNANLLRVVKANSSPEAFDLIQMVLQNRQ